MRLEGARALITGAGSGLGLALAEEASRRGMSLILAGRSDDALREARANLARPHAATVCVADVTTQPGRRALLETTRHAMAGLDILVNNAGVQTVAPLDGHDDEAIAVMLATNLAAPMALTRDLLPLLRVSERARVVNIGSMFGDIAFPLFAAYSATKFGLRGFSDALRRELAEDGIGVTHVAPRAVRTPAFARHDNLAEPFAMKVDAPGRVATRIWDAVAAGHDSLYPGFEERVLLVVQRLTPGVIDRALAGRLRKARAMLARHFA